MVDYFDEILILSSTFENYILKIAKKKPKLNKMPKGWKDPTSVKKYWKSLTEGDKHPWTKCVERLKKKKMKNPEAFCAKMKDVAEGTTKWRGGEKKKKKPSKKK